MIDGWLAGEEKALTFLKLSIFCRTGDNLNVPYYVGDHFTKEYTGMNLKNLEQSVEEYISNLRNNCWKNNQVCELFWFVHENV